MHFESETPRAMTRGPLAGMAVGVLMLIGQTLASLTVAGMFVVYANGQASVMDFVPLMSFLMLPTVFDMLVAAGILVAGIAAGRTGRPMALFTALIIGMWWNLVRVLWSCVAFGGLTFPVFMLGVVACASALVLVMTDPALRTKSAAGA